MQDILYNFNKGRKVLVICDSINEAYQINNSLFEDGEGNYDYADIKSNIFLYTRSDKVEEDFLVKNCDKRIFLSIILEEEE